MVRAKMQYIVKYGLLYALIYSSLSRRIDITLSNHSTLFLKFAA